jgi:hypothetical protein
LDGLDCDDGFCQRLEIGLAVFIDGIHGKVNAMVKNSAVF